MRAMVLEGIGEPLVLKELANPSVLPEEVLVRVEACGVCRTDLHVVDGELPLVKPPVVPGHEIVGVVERVGYGVEELVPGMRVGVPWCSRQWAPRSCSAGRPIPHRSRAKCGCAWRLAASAAPICTWSMASCRR